MYQHSFVEECNWIHSFFDKNQINTFLVQFGKQIEEPHHKLNLLKIVLNLLLNLNLLVDSFSKSYNDTNFEQFE